jgi:Ca2+-binding EF-hand superfamily protein
MIDERYRTVFSVLDENESGEITLDELGKFLRELFKEQIKELQEVIEREKIVQAMIARDASSPGKRTA